MVQTFFVGVREAENILPIVGDRGNLVFNALIYHLKSDICNRYLFLIFSNQNSKDTFFSEPYLTAVFF